MRLFPPTLLLVLTLCSCVSPRGSDVDVNDVDIVRDPAVILARATGDATFIAADPEGTTGAIYETRLEIDDVIAGRMVNREADAVRVRLMAGNIGYLARGAELIVVLDPARIKQRLPLYWRRPMSFACVETAELDRLGLRFESPRTFTFEGDRCVP